MCNLLTLQEVKGTKVEINLQTVTHVTMVDLYGHYFLSLILLQVSN